MSARKWRCASHTSKSTIASSACVFGVSPAPATSSTLRPSCKILRHSQTTSGGHRRTSKLLRVSHSAVPQTYPRWPKRLIAPTPRVPRQPRENQTFKSSIREPHFSHCQLFQRHRSCREPVFAPQLKGKRHDQPCSSRCLAGRRMVPPTKLIGSSPKGRFRVVLT